MGLVAEEGVASLSERPFGLSRTEDLPSKQQGREGAGVTLADVTFGYHLDRSDSDVSVLKRLDGSVVATFGVHTIIEEDIAQAVVDAAEKDYRDLIRAPRSDKARCTVRNGLRKEEYQLRVRMEPSTGGMSSPGLQPGHPPRRLVGFEEARRHRGRLLRRVGASRKAVERAAREDHRRPDEG